MLLPMAESLLGQGLCGVTKGNEQPLNVARGKYPMTFEVADPCCPLECIRGKRSRLDVGVGVTVDAWTARVSGSCTRLGAIGVHLLMGVWLHLIGSSG